MQNIIFISLLSTPYSSKKAVQLHPKYSVSSFSRYDYPGRRRQGDHSFHSFLENGTRLVADQYAVINSSVWRRSALLRATAQQGSSLTAGKPCFRSSLHSPSKAGHPRDLAGVSYTPLIDAHCNRMVSLWSLF
jgi:hypothetical protein